MRRQIIADSLGISLDDLLEDEYWEAKSEAYHGSDGEIVLPDLETWKERTLRLEEQYEAEYGLQDLPE